MLDVFVRRDHEEVNQAVMQFVARRSYTLAQPWYLEGLRIEIPLPRPDAPRGFWASISDSPANPRIDIELKRKRRGTRIKITVGSHPDSIKLAYELQNYLQEDRSYDPQCPAVCYKCGNPVRSALARFCGRCGHQFSAGTDMVRPPVIDRAGTTYTRETLTVAPPPPIPSVAIERDDLDEEEVSEEYVPPADEQQRPAASEMAVESFDDILPDPESQSGQESDPATVAVADREEAGANSPDEGENVNVRSDHDVQGSAEQVGEESDESRAESREDDEAVDAEEEAAAARGRRALAEE